MASFFSIQDCFSLGSLDSTVAGFGSTGNIINILPTTSGFTCADDDVNQLCPNHLPLLLGSYYILQQKIILEAKRVT